MTRLGSALGRGVGRMELTRRTALLGFGAAAATALSTSLPGLPIQTIAGERQMLFGSAVRAGHLSDPALREALVQEVGALTAEVEMKWAHIEPEPGRFAFADADLVANFAQAHQKRLHGHTLLWHRSIPSWAAQAWLFRADWRPVEAFIGAMLKRYDGVQSWDVVNEPIATGDDTAILRRSPFLEAFGPGYIAGAFHSARRHAPGALLCLNEFGLEYDIPEHRQKRTALLQLLTQLRRDNVPIDAVGIQAHLDLADQHHFNPAVFASFLDQIGSLGFQIRISELDVKEANPRLPIDTRDQLVADAVRRLLDVALANEAVGSVTCWGLSDKYSWLDESGDNRGLPLDRDLQPKPMRDAIAQAISSSRSGT